MSNPYRHNGGNALTLPSQKLLLSLSLDDLGKFVKSLDIEELQELLHFYEIKECFESCIVVRNHINSEKKRIHEQNSEAVYS